RYSFKAWQDGTSEPAGWDVVGSGPVGELTTGSITLTAHHTDATFGRVTITRLTDSPAIISNVVATPANTQVQVSWNTDESTTGVVQYGLTQNYELGSVSDSTNGTGHSVLLPNLQPGTTYHYR